MSAPDVLPPAEPPVRAGREAGAALLVVLGCVLLAAPVGLLWAALTPRVQVTSQDGAVSVPDPTTSAFIATDGLFLLVVLVVGLVVGLAAALAGGRRPFGTVLGLALGGLLAAELARRTGALVGRDQAEALLAAGADGAFELPPRVRSWPVLVGWPVAALLAHAVVTAVPLAQAWWRRNNPFVWGQQP